MIYNKWKLIEGNDLKMSRSVEGFGSAATIYLIV